MVLSERIIVGCNRKHSCSPHSQQVSGMNRGFLLEQLPLMCSSSFPETQLAACRASLGQLRLSNTRLPQKSGSPQGSACDPHYFFTFDQYGLFTWLWLGVLFRKGWRQLPQDYKTVNGGLLSRHSVPQGSLFQPLLPPWAQLGGGTLLLPSRHSNQRGQGESRVGEEGK